MENEPQTTTVSGAADGGDSHGNATSRRHAILVAVKVAVSVVLLWLLFSTYDISDVLARLFTVKAGFLALALLTEIVAIGLATWRWDIILRQIGVQLGFAAALPIVFIGLFFNQVLPSNLGGDAMRIWRVFKRGADLVYAVGSVMLDRIVALLGMVLLVLACLPFAPGLTNDPLLLRALIAVVVITFAGLVFLLALERILPLARRLATHSAMQKLTGLSRDMRRFLLSISASAPAVILSICNQILMVILIYALAQGLNIGVSFIECLVLIPPVVLISMLPISFAGWGVREGAMVAAFGFVGVAPGDAIAISVIFGLILVATSLPGGVIWFISGNRNRR